VNIFLTSMSDYHLMNQVYSKAFKREISQVSYTKLAMICSVGSVGSLHVGMAWLKLRQLYQVV
jgi:hypothetical protein